MAKLNDEAFGSLIGKDRTLVSRYRRGEVTPPLEVIADIDKATNSAVSFRDFLAVQERAAP
jgi:transcriptional regulator with XRE-family HTH domain